MVYVDKNKKTFVSRDERKRNQCFFIEIKKKDESQHVCRSCVVREISFAVLIISQKFYILV
jgi:hypothetical protein